MTDSNTELATKFAAHTDKVKEIAEDLKGKMATGEKLSQTAIDKADEALATMTEIKTRLDNVEQKQATRKPNGENEYQSIGEKFADSDVLKALQADPRG